MADELGRLVRPYPGGEDELRTREPTRLRVGSGRAGVGLGVGSGRLLGVGVGWTEEGVVQGLGCHGAYISSGRPMEGEKNKKNKKGTEVGVEAKASPPRDVCAGERLDRYVKPPS